MKTRPKVLLGTVAALLLVVGAGYFASGNLLQGKISPSAVSPCSASSTVFEGDVDSSADFISLLSSLSSSVVCPYSIYANAYPVDGHYPMNAYFECSSTELEVQYDTTNDSYQIECTQVTDGLTQEVRANLTPEDDGTYTLGVNMDIETDHVYNNFTLDPDTLSITKMKSSDY